METHKLQENNDMKICHTPMRKSKEDDVNKDADIIPPTPPVTPDIIPPKPKGVGK